jgi:hypothetical protein
MFVLANRPGKAIHHYTNISILPHVQIPIGFPFLGNDFYREIGDVFATHCVDNPDFDSEMALLRKYAPSVPEDLLQKLTLTFNDLRRLVDEGLLNYPYSTRELVSIVRHLEAYPGEGLARALGNVFDFDSYETEARELLIETLNKNGIPTGMESEFKVQLGESVPLPNPIVLESWNRLPPSKFEKLSCAIETAKMLPRVIVLVL